MKIFKAMAVGLLALCTVATTVVLPAQSASAAPASQPGTYEDNSPAVILTGGGWAYSKHSKDSGGGSSYTAAAVASASFTFSGTSIDWISRTTNKSGINNVYIDNKLVASVDRYSAVTAYQQKVFSTTSLSPGTHTIRVTTTNKSNAAPAASRTLQVDAFVIPDQTPPASPTGVTATKTRSGASLSWQASASTDVVGYKIQRSAPNVATVTMPDTVTGTSFVDSGLPENVNYTYRVLALDGAGNASPAATETFSMGGLMPTVYGRYTKCPTATVNVSTAAEFRTALANAKAGDSIRLNDGVYKGPFRLADVSGPRAVWICGSRKAIIDNGGTSNQIALSVKNSKSVVVSGFTVRNARQGVLVESSSNVTVSDMHISSMGYEAIHVRVNSTGSYVVNNTIRSTGLVDPMFGEGIYIGSSSTAWCDYTNCNPDKTTNVTVANNDIRQTTAEAIEAKEGTSGGLIYGNVIDGSTTKTPSAYSWIQVKGNDWIVAQNKGYKAPDHGFRSIVTGTEWGHNNVFAGNYGTANSTGYGVYLAYADNVVDCLNGVKGAAKGATNRPCQP